MQLTENTLFDNRYRLKRLIGRGGFAEVWLVEDTLTDLEEAIKIYAPGAGLDEDGVKLFIKELAVVHDLRHTNLLTPKTMGQCDRQPYLVLPYCPHGSLTKKVQQISEEEAWKIIRQVASGLAYLHDKGIVHQDIKPDNILIDANGDYVITDFGISMKAQSTLRKSMRATAQSGTTNYMAPERFTSIKPRPENDIWSLGAMMYELLEGDVPFNTPVGSLVQQNGAQIPAMESTVSDKLKNKILSMLALNVDDRPRAAALAGVTFEHVSGPSLNDGIDVYSVAYSAATTRIDVEALKAETEAKRKAEEEAKYIEQVRKEAQEALARQQAKEAEESRRRYEERKMQEEAERRVLEAQKEAERKSEEADTRCSIYPSSVKIGSGEEDFVIETKGSVCLHDKPTWLTVTKGINRFMVTSKSNDSKKTRNGQINFQTPLGRSLIVNVSQAGKKSYVIWGLVAGFFLGFLAITLLLSKSEPYWDDAEVVGEVVAEEVAEEVAESFSISPSSYVFEYAGGELALFFVDSDCDWFVKLDVVSWAHLSRNGNDLILWCDDNYAPNPRSDYFIISNGTTEIRVDFTQN